MLRKVMVLASVATLGALLSLSCKDSGGGAGAEAGAPPAKLICKMNNQCWICPDDGAFKKCIINPVTSGCKLASGGECS